MGFLLMQYISGLILAFVFQPAHVSEGADFYEDEVEATAIPGLGDFHAEGIKKDIQASIIARSRQNVVEDEELVAP